MSLKHLTETLISVLPCGEAARTMSTQKDDEDKRGGVTDPGGTTGWIATKVE